MNAWYNKEKTMNNEEPSRQGYLNRADWKKIGKGALIAIGGAVVTYLQTAIPNMEIGPTWTPLLMAANSVLVNIALKAAEGQKRSL